MLKKLILPLSILAMTMTINVSANDTKQQTTVNAEQQQFSDLDLAKWAMPVSSFYAQKTANVRDMNAMPNQILFWSQPFDSNNQILTPNDTVLYISAQIETFNGPMVLEVPAAQGELGIFGSLVTPFMEPLEDVGGSKGIDQNNGGKILITPPGYKGEIPADYLHVPSEHFNTVAGFRITPDSFEEKDIAVAVNFIKSMKLHPLGSNEATVFVDGENKPYNPRPLYGKSFFVFLDKYIQEENHKAQDLPFIEELKRLGLEKGKKFEPTQLHESIGNALYTDRTIAFANVGEQFFPDSNWTTPVQPMEAMTQFTYVDDNGYHWEERSLTWHWAIWGPKHLGGDSFYLIGQKEANGDILTGDKTYKFTVPANVPAEKFWSVTVYDATTGGTFFKGLPKVGISSKQQDLDYNEDGSTTLYFGPEKPVGVSAGNYVPTQGDDKWFSLFRWYGPQPELMPPAGDDRWTMGNFELVN